MKSFQIVSILLLINACNSKKINSGNEPWIVGFNKPAQNPILTADSTFVFLCPVLEESVNWQLADVFNPAAIVKDDTVFMLFRAEDNPKAILGGRTSRIGLAYSLDGLNFTKFDQPVLYPEPGEFMQWDYPGGCEDPRVVKHPDGGYVMTYTSWERKTARLTIATSPDLRKWQKHGPAFEKAFEGKFLNNWSKSGAILSEFVNNELTAVAINGKYWMYWGEAFVNVAYSEDLINWFPTVDEKGELAAAMETRPGKFDSFLTEPGPPAILTADGIILFYNGKNDEGEKADVNIAKGTYCGGQALFEAKNPAKLIKRMDQPFICPDLPHEITGQYAAGTTFIEGLVKYRNQWFLYYGTADSMVGVAVADM